MLYTAEKLYFTNGFTILIAHYWIVHALAVIYLVINRKAGVVVSFFGRDQNHFFYLYRIFT